MNTIEESREITKKICKALDDKKAIDIKVIDISGISDLADFFIMASADNSRMLNSLMDAVGRTCAENNVNEKSIEGNQNSTWVLMDYEDIIVHLFSKEDRVFYNLERIWQDGVQIPFEEL